MTLSVPLRPVPSQTLSVDLGNQPCQINVFQKLTGLYLDLYVNNAEVVTGVLCENLNRIVRNLYLGFQGDLAFVDTAGDSDPTFDGLGSRFVLAYLAADELPEGVG